MHASKSFFYRDGEPWIKKSSNSLFDVTMGSYDGAEVCEIVGLYLMNDLTKIVSKDDIGLYRDDGLAIVRNKSGPQIEALRKKIIKLFKDNDLRITIETSLKITDFLDVSLNLRDNIYSPHRKPNDDPQFINRLSSHPPNILKQIPTMVSKRLSSLSVNESEFEKAKEPYVESLKKSGYNEDLKYTTNNASKKKRKRNVIWFNPPFDLSVKTNVAKEFLSLIKKHFTSSHKLSKIFNLKTLKVSYCCMPSIKSIISSHNSSILKKSSPDPEPSRECNCQVRGNCPLNGHCLQSNIIYQAQVNSENSVKNYIGLCEGSFKLRFSNHKKSFNHRKYSHETELSKYIWQLKDNGTDYSLSWSILSRSKPYQGGGNPCDLCLTEKLLINKADSSHLLNKRDELISKCRHRNKFLLKCLK